MKFSRFQQYFSEARIERYLIATGFSTANAIKLYKANLKISKAFHPLLGIFEVVLRNQLDRILAAYFSDPNWIINQKTGFMSDASLKFKHKRTGKYKCNDFLKKEIQKVEKRLQKTKRPITNSKLISEQNLGFWTDLFEIHHYRILKGKPIQIFKSLPPRIGRKEIKSHLNKIRRFRNRINHNEPICFYGNTIDFTLPIEVHQSLVNLLGWIDPEIQKLTANLDQVIKEIEAASMITKGK